MRRLLLIAAFTAACSAESAPVPELDVRMPGAFTAFVRDSGELDLFRTVSGSTLDNGDRLMIFIYYEPHPRDFEDARRLAQEPSLPEHVHQFFEWQSRILGKPHEVVWFRTLTDEEIHP